MGKKRDLSIQEKFSIKILKGIGLSITKIAEAISRHKSTISRYLACPKDNNNRRNCGRKSILDYRTLRRVGRMVSRKPVSANYIVRSLKLRCSDQTLRRAMKKNEISWVRCKQKIPLTKENKRKRIEFCREYLANEIQWKNYIFSDEKRFCKDGIQDLMYGWSKRNKRHVIMKRHSEGGSIMVWGAIGLGFKSQLVIIDGRLNSEKYCEILDEHLIPLISPELMYQQDNAPIHVSRYTKNWMMSKNVRTFAWPARSPDINIIENVWAHMSKEVYANCKQYNTVEEFKKAVLTSWAKLNDNFIENLYKSIPRRLLSVLDHRGDQTSY